MKKILKKFWHWLRCEDENGNPIPVYGIPMETAFRYSELIGRFPIHGKIGDDDIVQISHKIGEDAYETCYVTVKQLKEALR